MQIPIVDIEMLDGERLEAKGVAPDIEIFPKLAELDAGMDPALARAEQELPIRGATLQ